MFLFDLKRIVVENNELIILSKDIGELNPCVLSILNEFEKNVYTELEKVYDFKYVQGTVGANKIFNQLKKGMSKDIYVEMITQHPSYTSGILINDLIPNNLNGNEVYTLYFTGEFGKCWLNSQTKSNNLILEIKQLLKISEFKNRFEINVIEIYDSDRLKFQESQKGASNKRWKLKN